MRAFQPFYIETAGVLGGRPSGFSTKHGELLVSNKGNIAAIEERDKDSVKEITKSFLDEQLNEFIKMVQELYKEKKVSKFLLQIQFLEIGEVLLNTKMVRELDFRVDRKFKFSATHLPANPVEVRVDDNSSDNKELIKRINKLLIERYTDAV